MNMIVRNLQDYDVVESTQKFSNILEEIESCKPNLVIIDVGNSVEKQKYEKLITEIYPEFPLLMITTYDHLKELVLKKKSADYINKPFSSEDLLEKIKNLIKFRKDEV